MNKSINFHVSKLINIKEFLDDFSTEDYQQLLIDASIGNESNTFDLKMLNTTISNINPYLGELTLDNLITARFDYEEFTKFANKIKLLIHVD